MALLRLVILLTLGLLNWTSIYSRDKSCSHLFQNHENQIVNKASTDSINERAFDFRKSDPECAKRLAYIALAQSEKINYQIGQGDAFARLTVIYRNLHLPDSAIWAGKKSLQIREALKDTNGISSVYNLMALTLMESDRFQEAIPLFYSSLELATDPFIILALHSNLCKCQMRLTNFQAAIKHGRKAVSISIKSEQPVEGYEALLNLGASWHSSYQKSGFSQDLWRLDSAEHYYKMALTIARDFEDSYEIANNLNNLGLIALDREQASKAYILLLEAAQRFTKVDPKAAADVQVNLALSQYRQGNLSKVDSILKAAEPFFDSTKAGLSHLDYYYTTHLLLKDRGNLDAAILALQKSVWLRDSLLSQETIQSSQLSSLNYQNNRLDQDLENLKLTAAQDRLQTQLLLVIFSATILVGLILFLLYRQKQLSKRKELEHLLKKRELEITQALLEGRELEQQRIGADLHDRVGGNLSALKFKMEDMADHKKIDYRAELNLIISHLDQVVTEVRQISHGMVDHVLTEFGLEAALNDLVSAIRSGERLKISIRSFGWPQHLNGRVELHLYRIIQELVTNILKHANASEAGVILRKHPNGLQIEVWDNGIGFNNESQNGIGWTNIRNRLRLIDGIITPVEDREQGSAFLIEIPPQP